MQVRSEKTLKMFWKEVLVINKFSYQKRLEVWPNSEELING
jgi:hypothetical protein